MKAFPSQEPSFIEVPFQVPPECGGARLDVFLTARLHRHSRSTIARFIDEGRVFLRGKSAKASLRVKGGESVVIRYPARVDPPSRHEVLPVLYEDEAVLAVNKPGDVLSHPTDKLANNSATVILAKQFPGCRLHLAHRLDRETSGVLLFAKSPRYAAVLMKQFSERKVRKEYWALVSGRVAFKRKVVELALGYDDHEVRVRQRVFTDGTGQAAKTEFGLLAAGESISLVRAIPKTGRLHQIRVHLAWLGHPVIGDKIYTGEGEAFLKIWSGAAAAEDMESLGASRQMLHARKLQIKHPVTGKKIVIEASLPEDFVACAKEAGLRFQRAASAIGGW